MRSLGSAPFLGWVVFLTVAVVVTAIASCVNDDPLLVPERGLRKIAKLVWFSGLTGVAAVISIESSRAKVVLRAFVLGTAATAALVLALNPAKAWLESSLPDDYALYRSQTDPDALSPGQKRLTGFAERTGLLDPSLYEALKRRPHRPILSPAAEKAINAQPLLRWAYSGGWKAGAFGPALAKHGTMASSQRLMLGLLAALLLFLDSSRLGEVRQKRQFAAIAALVAAGLFATCKRGPILVFAIVSTAMLVFAGLGVRRTFVLLVLFAAIAVSAPQVRARFCQIPSELPLEKGGRTRMWFVMAPQLRREKPHGIGFRALTYEKMRDMDIKLTGGKVWVEVGRNHVHCTPLQVLVDLGWPGLALWLVWMLLSLRSSVRLARRLRPSGEVADGGSSFVCLVPAAFLSALLAYGLVEYNFADSEIVLLYALTLGLTAAGAAGRSWSLTSDGRNSFCHE